MFCIKCGHELREGARFCTNCGAPVSQPVQSVNKAEGKGEKPVSQLQNPNPPSRQEHSGPALDHKKVKLQVGILSGVILIAVAMAAGLIYGIGRQGKEAEETAKEDRGRGSGGESQRAIVQTEGTEPGETDTAAQPDSSTEAPGEPAAAEAESEAPAAGGADGAHTYQIFVEDVTWIQAFNKAQQMGGYLVNINSEEEQQQICNMIREEGYEKNIFWIGARRRDTGDYYWADGKDNLYGSPLNNSANWMENEPSLYDSETGELETYVNMFYYEKENRFVWNDVPNDISIYYPDRISYIVESEPGDLQAKAGGNGDSGSDDGWKQAYIDYIDSCSPEGTEGFALIYVDHDNIPELVDVGIDEATGTRIVTYSGGKTYATQLNRLGFTYIEKENLLNNEEGHMGYYYDYIYSILNGQMHLVYQGQYFGDSADMQTNEETGRWITTTYRWQGVEMDEKTYWQELNKVYDTSKSKYGYDWERLYSFDRAKEVIGGY